MNRISWWSLAALVVAILAVAWAWAWSPTAQEELSLVGASLVLALLAQRDRS